MRTVQERETIDLGGKEGGVRRQGSEGDGVRCTKERERMVRE
jgi:hypothetical protein